VKNAVNAMLEASKPIGALCITPAVIAKILEGRSAKLTKETTHAEVVIDEKLKLVTSPCYMLDASISQIAEGAENTVSAMLGLI
jgi:enhancing lycopene biosynthesis protein 2